MSPRAGGLLVALVLSICAVAAQAAAPKLANLQIEIWPEYDRSAALVLLKAELPSDAPLPASLSVRIPASTGGPSAVAFAKAENGELSNLAYERSDAKDWITLRLKVPERFFHVEFYDHFVTGDPARDYRYVWPGDAAVEKLSAVVQEPAGATDFSVRPELADTASGQEGLRYRSAQLGSHPAGKPLTIEIRYTKTDPRTSTEILKLNAAPVPQTSREAAEAPAASRALPILGVVLPLLLAAAAAGFVWWRRRTRSAPSASTGRFCSHCGHRAGPEDRFCSKCGKALA